jgi:hypothetical protein
MSWKRAATNLLVEVGLCPSVVGEFELGRSVRAQVGVKDAERVEVSSVMTTNLVRSDEKLDLVVAKRARSERREDR